MLPTADDRAGTGTESPGRGVTLVLTGVTAAGSAATAGGAPPREGAAAAGVAEEESSLSRAMLMPPTRASAAAADERTEGSFAGRPERETREPPAPLGVKLLEASMARAAVRPGNFPDLDRIANTIHK